MNATTRLGYAAVFAAFLSIVVGLIVWGFNATYTPHQSNCTMHYSEWGTPSCRV